MDELEILAEYQITRLKEALGVRKKQDLARILKISPQSITQWKSKAQNGVVPPYIVIKIAVATNTSIDYLYFGKGEKYCDYSDFKYRDHPLFKLSVLKEDTTSE